MRRSRSVRRRLATLKAEIATAHRRFDFTARCWMISADAYTSLEPYLELMEARYCASIFIRDETADERQQREHQAGRAAGSGAQDGKGQQPTRHVARTSIEHAYDTLYLRKGAPIELIHGAYRVLAKLHHPDKGGKTERMVAINDAYDLLIAKVGVASAA